jgi:hypothetical protein
MLYWEPMATLGFSLDSPLLEELSPVGGIESLLLARCGDDAVILAES